MERRSFLGSALAGVAAQGARSAPSSFEFVEITIDELGKRMAAGRETAHSIAQRYLERIRAVDGRLRSVIEINPDALPIAAALDRERREKGPRGPLHGVPVLIKDNIDTADRMMTTAGSLALVGPPPGRDAFVAERLRAAGAVILGKTNLSEWANFRSTHSVSGWSGRGDQTRNPYALDRNPCGSSSGSGAAIAANLCAVAIGTETDGSVVCPSAMNGIVGVKPTVGLISRSGIVPIAHSQDTAGPMARTVRDAATLLSVLTAVDPNDAASVNRGSSVPPDYTRFLDPAALRGARLGIARKFFGNNGDVDKLIQSAIDEMKRLGAEIIDPVDLAAQGYADAENDVLLYEFKTDLNSYLERRGGGHPVKSLSELIAFNEKHRDREMPWFGQELFLQAEGKGPLSDKAYLEALAKSRRLAREDGIDATMAKHKLDAIVAPTAGPAWLIDWVNGDHDTGGCSTPAAVAGYPHITVPAGFVHSLPIGISFFGKAWSEPKLFALAYSFEQATKARREPKLLATVSLAKPW